MKFCPYFFTPNTFNKEKNKTGLECREIKIFFMRMKI